MRFSIGYISVQNCWNIRWPKKRCTAFALHYSQTLECYNRVGTLERCSEDAYCVYHRTDAAEGQNYFSDDSCRKLFIMVTVE